jgi:hypothetical protein
MHLSTRILGVSLFAIGAISMAHAGCATAQWGAAPAAASDIHPMVFRPDDDNARLVRVDDGRSEAKIVGLWKFEMISQSTPKNTNPMPDGTLVDFGTAVWHGDGTEFQTSGIRNPGDGNVCQGVWTQIGPSTFQLNHYALSWTSGAYTGPVNIRAIVRVDSSGSRYAGLFQTDVYLASLTAGHEFDETTKLVTITGTFTATRVNISN